jgi:hypothetical protein
MVKFHPIQSALLISTLIIASLSALPLQAAIRQQPHQSIAEIKDTYLALSWGDIWDRLRRKKSPAGSRGGGICAIAPAKLVDRDAKQEDTQVPLEVWSDRPLFLWNIQGGTAQRIELSREGNKGILWYQQIERETRAVYDGKPLESGQSYVWELFASVPYPVRTSVLFQVMEPEKRDRITAELTALEKRLKKERASAETIALEKANYFAQRELWSDALWELYSVPKPSAELRDAIEQIQTYDFCTEDKPNVPAS